MFWGIAAFLVGVVIAAQLVWPQLSFDSPYLDLRPPAPAAHVRGHLRLRRHGADRHGLPCRAAHLPHPAVRRRAARLVRAAGLPVLHRRRPPLGYLFGITQSKEYAEPEWFVDFWLTIVWVAYLIAYLGTVMKREEPHIYVANWFYLAFIITIAMLHIVNNLALPVSITGTKSYGAWSGVQDAMIQWWYGHNAVGFFLTAAFLGMMYYYIPKAANRPVYSYRLSIIHFWSLVFMYIWAGPHHLHYTSLPDWAQTLGMAFSVMLWMPSWGGMINGLMTLVGRVGQAAHRSRPALLRHRRRLLRHGDLRGAGHVHQGRQLAQSLHRLDDRPCPFRRTGLGRLHRVRHALLHGAEAVEPAGHVVHAPDRLALLDRDHRHRPLHHRDVGERHHAGPDVARLRRARVPPVLVRRDASRPCIPST